MLSYMKEMVQSAITSVVSSAELNQQGRSQAVEQVRSLIAIMRAVDEEKDRLLRLGFTDVPLSSQEVATKEQERSSAEELIHSLTFGNILKLTEIVLDVSHSDVAQPLFDRYPTWGNGKKDNVISLVNMWSQDRHLPYYDQFDALVEALSAVQVPEQEQNKNFLLTVLQQKYASEIERISPQKFEADRRRTRKAVDKRMGR